MKLGTKRSQMRTRGTFPCAGCNCGTDERRCLCCCGRLLDAVPTSGFSSRSAGSRHAERARPSPWQPCLRCCGCSRPAWPGPPQHPRSDSAVRGRHPQQGGPAASQPCSLHLLPLWPGSSPTPLPHCGQAEPPTLLPRFIPRHMVEKQGSVAKRDNWNGRETGIRT